MELDCQERAQKRSAAGRWSWTLKREPRRDQQQGGGAGLSRESPEEIRRREVELDSQERAQKRSGGGKWSWTLKREPRTDQEEGSGTGLSRESPIEFKSWETELERAQKSERAQKRSRAGRWSWTYSRMVCLAAGLFLNSCFSDTVLVTLLRTAVGIAVSEVQKLLRTGGVPSSLHCCSGDGWRCLIRTGGVPTSLTLLLWRWLAVSSHWRGPQLLHIVVLAMADDV